MSSLSLKHLQVRDCALRLQAEMGYPPSYKQIMAELGMKSFGQLHKIMKDLESSEELKLEYKAKVAGA